MSERTGLLRVLGMLFGISVAVGGTIGQGILRSPGNVASGISDPIAIMAIWVLGGLLSAVDLTCTAELATMIRKTGGPYIFVRTAFGRFTGLATGLADSLSIVAATAFVSVVFGEYLHRLGILVTVPVGLLAVVLPLALGAVQLLGTRIAGGSQEVGSAIKCVLLLILVGALLTAPRGAPLPGTPPPVALTLVGVITAIRAVFGTYNGWNSAAYFCEEVVDPKRDIARASFVGLAVVTGIYLLVNAAMLNVLTPAEMAGDNLVAAKAAARVFGERADTIVTAVSLVSLVTLVNVNLMLVPRILFAIARDAQIGWLQRVTRRGTPWPPMLLTVALACGLALGGVYDALLALSTALFAAVAIAVNLAAVRLRITKPDVERPYRMPFYPAPLLIALPINAALFVAFFIDDPRNSALGFVLLATLTAACYAGMKSRTEKAAVAA